LERFRARAAAVRALPSTKCCASQSVWQTDVATRFENATLA